MVMKGIMLISIATEMEPVNFIQISAQSIHVHFFTKTLGERYDPKSVFFISPTDILSKNLLLLTKKIVYDWVLV